MLKKSPLYNFVFIAFIIFVIFPVIYTFGLSIIEKDFFSNFTKAISGANLWLLGKSFAMALIIALLSSVFGVILGFLLYKIIIPFQNIFKIVILIPLFISPYVLAVAWKDFFFLINDNIDFRNAPFGVILVLTSIYTPLSILIIGSALSNINASIEESALLLTNHRRMIFRILLPLIKPALFTSFALVFIFSISEFSIPAYFGVKVFTTEIFVQFSAFYHHSLAIIQSSFLVIICLSLLFTEKNYIADAPFLSIGKKGLRQKTYTFKKIKIFGFSFILLWLLTSVVLPISTLSFYAFKDGSSKFIQAFDLLLPTFFSSISLALWGAFGVLFIGFIIAHNPSNSKLFNRLLLIIFAIPSTIFGISLIKFYNQPFFNFIYSSSAIIIIAYIGKFSFISSKLIENGMKQIPKSIHEAAIIQGTSTIKRILFINIPILLPSIMASFLIGFIFSLGELGTIIMLYPPGTELMPIKVFTIMANAPQALTSSMTLIVFSVTSLLVLVLYSTFKLLYSKQFGRY
jgi:ABC-type Fe3+ transport system permease subunit